MKKGTSFTHNSNSCANSFPQNNSDSSVCSSLCVFPNESYRNFERHRLKDQASIKLIIVTAPSRTFLSESGFSLLCKCVAVKIQGLLVQCRTTAWPTVSPTTGFHHQCKCQHSGKGRESFHSIIVKTVSLCRTLRKGLRKPYGPAVYALKNTAVN